tara:strand:+ start:61 stop:627 length:567 start_codon:yes stop_codon:yes gene_type:complete
MISENKLDKLGKLIQSHIELYPKISVKAEQFESLFSVVTESDWNPNNHNPNEDMITEIKGIQKPSLKSGVIKNNILEISSHRTTTYKTLQDKIEFLKSRDYDSYICLARPNKDQQHNYNLIYFNKNVINYDSLNWVDTYGKNGSHSGWCGKNKDDTITVKIIKSMSDQVWIRLNINKVKILRKYDFTK